MVRITRFWLTLFVALSLCMALGAAAADDESDAAGGEAYESPHSPVLTLPQTVWNALVYPIGELTIYAEHEELPQRVKGWFTNEAETFGIFPQVQLGGETRTGAAVRLFHTDLFGRAKELDVLYVFSAPGRQLGQLEYRDPTIEGTSLHWNLRGEYLRTDNYNATVNGGVLDEEALDDLSLDDDLARFEIERGDLTATLGWRSHAGELEDYQKGLSAEARLGMGFGELNEANPALPMDPERLTATALGRPRAGKSISVASGGVRLAYDDRDYKPPANKISHPLNYNFAGRVLVETGGLFHSYRDLFYPERGGLLAAEVDVEAGSKSVRYVRVGVEAQRFWTLFWRDRVLAARARLDKVHPLGDGLVPFYRLPTLGGGQRLRGYERGSFRGEGALLLALEYRYPIWDTWNAFLFHEEGQVFDAYGDLGMGEFDSSTGCGISLRTEEALLLSLRVAHSASEKALVGFSLEQEF